MRPRRRAGSALAVVLAVLAVLPGAGVAQVQEGMVCAARIADGGCTAEQALDLLDGAETPDALYVRSGLLVMAKGPAALADAAVLVRRAAEQGHPQAQYEIGIAQLRRATEGEAEAATRADRWLRAAAEQKHSEAAYALGLAYMLGDVLSENAYEGSYLLEQAAAQDHAAANFEAGRIYRDGFGVAQDLERAEAYFVRAGELGHPDAFYEAAATILRERSVDRDMGRALAHARRAAEGGHAFALLLAGDILTEGPLPLRDASQARAYFTRAAQSSDAKVAQLGQQRLQRRTGPSIADVMRGDAASAEAAAMSTEMLLLGTGMALMVLGAQGAGDMPGYTPNYDHYSSTVHTWSGIAIGEIGRP